MKLTIAHLQECLTYDPVTGVFIWKTRPVEHFVTVKASLTWNARFAGRVAGGIDPDEGYRRIQIDGVKYKEHRLAFLFQGRPMPRNVDHENGRRDDNRWVNLRPATRSQNAHNRALNKNSSTKVKGVTWVPSRQQYYAQIQVDKKRKNLGFHDTLESAERAVKAAREALHQEFHNHG